MLKYTKEIPKFVQINKKGIVCITAYVNTEQRKELLKQCITSCKKLGMDVLVVSHSILSEDIIRMVDYYIYDADNRFSNGGHIILWKQISNIKINILSKYSHDYPVLRLMRNMLYTAKANGYAFFYAMDFDCMFSDEDITKLLDLKLRAINENKDFIFFYPENAAWEVDGEQLRGIFYDLYVYGGDVDKFLQIFDAYFPNTLEEYNKTLAFVAKGRPQCLEHYFYDAFKTKKSKTLVTSSYVNEYLNTSKINQSVLDKPAVVTILPSDNGKYYLYIANDNIGDYRFVVKMNQTTSEHILNGSNIQNSFHLIELMDNCHIEVELYQNYNSMQVRNLEFRREWHNEYMNNGIINIF